MKTNVVELGRSASQEEFERVDTSLVNTARCTARLGYKLGSLFLSKTVGIELPFVRSDQPEDAPKRHVELEPDRKINIETKDGSEHTIDIYGLEFFGDSGRSELPPLLMIMPLALPHDKGFQAPIIDVVQAHAKEQGRPVLVISSEGFGENPLSCRTLKDLSFEKMADNINEALDILEHRMYIKIPSIIATGASRGGTLSLMLASDETTQRRIARGQEPRHVDGVVSVAPAGLRPLDSILKKVKVAKQFLLYEPLHVARKASTLNPEDLADFGHTLLDSRASLKALPAVCKTGLLFMNEAPLEGIGNFINEETDIWVLTMENDGITTPKYWEEELEGTGAYVETLPGHHLSIDSIRKVAGAIIGHLNFNLAQYKKAG